MARARSCSMTRRVAVSLAVVVASGCAMDAQTDPAINPRVTVLPHVPGPDMTVSSNALAFPRSGNDTLLDLGVGDIVVSGAGEGFLRRVSSVDAARDHILIATTDADLSDALLDGSIAGSFGGQGKADTHQLPAISFSTSNNDLVREGNVLVKVLNASLSLDPQVDLDIGVQGGSLSMFELVLRGKLSGDIDLDIDALEGSGGPEITLWQSPPTIFYQQVGILPVVETITTSVRLKVEAVARGRGRLHIHAGASTTIEAGIKYDASGWSPVATETHHAEGNVPGSSATFDEVGARAWLVARVDVKLYGVAGPYVRVGPQIEIVRDRIHDDFDGSVGVRADVGGQVKFGMWELPSLPALELFNTLTPAF
ncbi:MAG: exported protein of unknown function [Myxococcales bacterium]|nr:exported protein of unknown function [Myxococcales bacterium]